MTPHFALKYRFNILEFLKNKKFGALVYGRSRVQEKSFTKLGRILKVPDSGILGGGVSPSLAGNEGTVCLEGLF